MAEREELRGLLDRAISGQGALVLVGGEAGVRKTRLTQELVTEAIGRGARSHFGHCYEGEGVPYLPFVEILEQALEGAPSLAAFRALLGADAPDIARLLPRLRRLFPDLPPPLDLPPDVERRHLFSSVRDVLARATAGSPAVLILEDLHWPTSPRCCSWSTSPGGSLICPCWWSAPTATTSRTPARCWPARSAI